MLQLRVFGATPEIGEVAERLGAIPGSRHVIATGDGASGKAVVTADLADETADAALDALQRLGVPDEDVVVLRVDAIRRAPSGRPLASVVWSDLLSQAGTNARPLARYLIFMGVAGVIAGMGVIYDNSILIVGAMAVSPDMLALTAACTGLALRRWRLAERAFTTLVVGLAFGCVTAGVMAGLLNLVDLLPSGFNIDATALRGLSSVNVSTVLVALAAGVAGILALETRASAGVGVAISVTTIPASAYLGVAVGTGEVSKALGALLVLAINVSMLLVSGSGTLLLQRRLARRTVRGSEHPAAGRGCQPGS